MTLFTVTEVELITLFLIFTRISGMMVANPVFGSVNLPMQYRVLMSVFLTTAISSVVPLTPSVKNGMLELMLRIVQEAVVGITIGYMVSLVFSVVSVAGQLIATAAGLQMASLFDPTLNTQSSALVTFHSTVLFLTFFALDLHHLLIKAIWYSFMAIPPGMPYELDKVGVFMAKNFGMIITTSLVMALPVLLVVLIINLSMAIIARIAPQMNVFFSVGAQANAFISLALLGLSMPMIGRSLSGLLDKIDPLLESLLKLMR